MTVLAILFSVVAWAVSGVVLVDFSETAVRRGDLVGTGPFCFLPASVIALLFRVNCLPLIPFLLEMLVL